MGRRLVHWRSGRLWPPDVVGRAKASYGEKQPQDIGGVRMSTNYYHPQTLEHIRNPLPAVADWATATTLAVPTYDPQTQQCRFVGGSWVVEAVSGKSNDEIITGLTAALERYYDATAQAKRYDNRFTCALRAGYVGTFQAEGLAFAQWMDTCNTHGYQVMADCVAGKRTIPTEAELIAELPVMVWP